MTLPDLKPEDPFLGLHCFPADAYLSDAVAMIGTYHPFPSTAVARPGEKRQPGTGIPRRNPDIMATTEAMKDAPGGQA